jgi:hypothetical protein
VKRGLTCSSFAAATARSPRPTWMNNFPDRSGCRSTAVRCSSSLLRRPGVPRCDVEERDVGTRARRKRPATSPRRVRQSCGDCDRVTSRPVMNRPRCCCVTFTHMSVRVRPPLRVCEPHLASVSCGLTHLGGRDVVPTTHVITDGRSRKAKTECGEGNGRAIRREDLASAARRSAYLRQ